MFSKRLNNSWIPLIMLITLMFFIIFNIFNLNTINAVSSWIKIINNKSNLEVNVKSAKDLIIENNLELIKQDKIITLWELIKYVLADTYNLNSNIKNIDSVNLNFINKKDLNKDLVIALKIWVITWVIKNLEINFPEHLELKEDDASVFLEKVYWVKILTKKENILTWEKLSKFIKIALSEYNSVPAENITNINTETLNALNSKYKITEVSNFEILNDAFLMLSNDFIDKEKISDEELLMWAIKWLAESVDDKYTVYFPPSDAISFQEHLNWEYEWIGAYVDMEDWFFKIISPIEWGPAYKAWIKPWDIILEIDDYKVTKDTTQKEAISRVKGKRWTTVNLLILRDLEEIQISIIRDKIRIKFVEYNEIKTWVWVIKIRSFWLDSYIDFKEIVDNNIENNLLLDKIIIDLRNNPGWSLDQVNKILSFFVEEWEPVSYMNTVNNEEIMLSQANSSDVFNNKEIVILINWGSASASEILAWTLKDYYPDIKIIWEKSYWKGTVQSIKTYSDSSSLKYTIAKWYTWKTKQSIDWVWIIPDYEILNTEEDILNWEDSQLDFAVNIR